MYDDYGQVSEERTDHLSEGPRERRTFTYDSLGRIIIEEVEEPNNGRGRETVYVYGGDRLLGEETTHLTPNGNWWLEILYRYDDEGCLVWEERSTESGPTTLTAHECDERGNRLVTFNDLREPP